MTNDQFEALVAKLEARARLKPRSYRAQVLLLGLLGYGYLVAALIVLLATMVASVVYLKAVGLKIAFAIGALLVLVVRAMWVRLAAPDGRRVTRDDAPQLFELIENLRKASRAPRFHRVLINGELNAGVVQIPRLGMFGWYRNYLLIGLPLMKSLTQKQFAAVLAHEFGHLAGGHGRVSNWIYRLRMSWAQLVQALDAQKSAGTFMFQPFFAWYSPYFNAWSFPLARANEYAADAAATRLVSPGAAAEALTGLRVAASYLNEHYWNDIHKRADDQPTPSFMPYAGLADALPDQIDQAASARWMQQSMADKTTASNTHPCLADRLEAMGQAPHFAPPAPGDAADQLIQPVLTAVTRELDEQWRAAIKESWERRYQEVQTGRRRLAELESMASKQQLPREEALERACLTESIGGAADAALDQFRAMHGAAPDDADLCFALGSRLLLRNDEGGVRLVEQAMSLNEEAIIEGCLALRDFYWRCRDKTRADAFNDRALERQRLLSSARAERANLHLNDKLQPHGLEAGTVADLRNELQKIGGLRKAYLVRKRVELFAESPIYVLGYTVSPWWRWRDGALARQVQKRIVEDVSFPGEAFVVGVEGDNRRLGLRLRRMRGSRIL